MKLLVVEDHGALGEMIAQHMNERGFIADRVSRGADALSALASAAYDAMILDLGLPDLDGLDVLRRLRQDLGADLPVLIVTARDRVDQRIAGLDAGADDYVLKPFDIAELEARLRAVLRRPGARAAETLSLAGLSFDPRAREARVDGAALDLTRREAALLEELLRQAGRVVVRDRLTDRLYGFDDDVSPNAIEATVSRLRRKLGGAGARLKIESLRGIGYRLRAGDGA